MRRFLLIVVPALVLGIALLCSAKIQRGVFNYFLSTTYRVVAGTGGSLEIIAKGDILSMSGVDWTGSCFVVKVTPSGDGEMVTVLTAAHAVEGATSATVDGHNLGLPTVHPTYDVALATFYSSERGYVARELLDAFPDVGTEVSATGFANHNPQTTCLGILMSEVRHTADCGSGSSGGPVSLLDGRVIGVITSGYSLSPWVEQHYNSVMVPIPVIADWLRANRVEL